MALNGAADGPNPELDFQLVGLQTGGSYTFNVSPAGKLDFIAGTTFPFGIDVGTMAELKCPIKMLPGGGIIQLGETHGDVLGAGSAQNSAGKDKIFVYGDDDTGYSLAEYIDWWVSDIKLKTDIERIKLPLQKINKLSGNTFKWKYSPKSGTNIKPGDADIGVIAQEVQKILPDAVNEKDGYLHVSYNKIIPLLIEGIKELSDQVNSLEIQIKELKG